MKVLFDRLVAEGSQAIHELVKEKAQENVQLDFKLKQNARNGELTRDDRGVLGVAISAFANSAGGLLVWGVEAKKDADKVDAATRAEPISSLAQFKSEATRAVADLLMPRHERIQIEAIEEKSAPGTGYLAIWVDQSERRPHRSEAAGDKRYYKRAGDSSFMMEHYDIEDAFNRVAPTELELIVERVAKGRENTKNNYRTLDFLVTFVLRNSGRLSACAPYITVDKVEGAETEVTHGGYFENDLARGHLLIYGSGSTFVHPGQDAPVFRLRILVGHYLGSDVLNHDGRPVEDSRVSVTCHVGCQNAHVRKVHFQWAVANLADLLEV